MPHIAIQVRHTCQVHRTFSVTMLPPSSSPAASVQVRDEVPGLDVDPAECEYSTDGGATWTAWADCTCSGSDGTTITETITASNVPFNQDSGTQNWVRFSISDTSGYRGDSPSYPVHIDTTGPEAQIEAPRRVTTPTITVTWEATDTLSGVATYDVQVRADDGPWTGWLTDTTQTQAEYEGEHGHAYGFRARARDNVGNLGDWAEATTAVVQVTKYYHFGGQRIAMRRNSVIYYLHGDHLGSTSFLTDDAGELVPGSEARFLPYGEYRTTPTAGLTDLGFTGQRAEGFGLYDYHARFYDPYLGRFISADTLVPEPSAPQSLNRYSYVYNRPLTFIDREGHFPWPVVVVIGGIVIGGGIGAAVVSHILPWDPPVMITDRVTDYYPITSNDMTGWLRHQMVTNAQSDVVRAIQENWTSGNLLKQDAAMQAWTALVGTDAMWDFKYDIRETEWFKSGIRDVTLGNSTVNYDLNYDAVANIHFGFVGRAAGFDADFLVVAAGAAQWKRWRKTGNPDDKGVCDMTYYCDHPYATWSIRFGIYVFERYKDRMDELDDTAFASALDNYIGEYGAPPAPPPGAVAP